MTNSKNPSTSKKHKSKKDYFGSLSLIVFGCVIGASMVGLLISTKSLTPLNILLVILGGLTVSVLTLGIVFKVFYHGAKKYFSVDQLELTGEKLAKALHDPGAMEKHKASLIDDAKSIAQLAFTYVSATRSIALISVLLGIVVSVATLMTAYIQIEKLSQQNQLINVQNSLAESSRRAAMITEMTSILDAIEDNSSRTSGIRRGLRTSNDSAQDYIEDAPISFDGGRDIDDPEDPYNRNTVLSALLIARVSSLSKFLKPYRYLEPNGELSGLLSPERAQLLTSLIAVGADIRELNTSGADFSYADLKNTRLTSFTKLGKINLSKADLAGLQLNGAMLEFANLRGATLPAARDFVLRNYGVQTEFSVFLDDAVIPESGWIGAAIKQNARKVGYVQLVRSDNNQSLAFGDIVLDEPREFFDRGPSETLVVLRRDDSEADLAIIDSATLFSLSMYSEEKNILIWKSWRKMLKLFFNLDRGNRKLTETEEDIGITKLKLELETSIQYARPSQNVLRFDQAQIKGAKGNLNSSLKRFMFSRFAEFESNSQSAEISENAKKNLQEFNEYDFSFLSLFHDERRNWPDEDFKDSNFTAHQFKCENCSFYGADLRYIEFNDSIFKSTDFRHCILPRVEMFIGTKFENTNLDKAYVEVGWLDEMKLESEKLGISGLDLDKYIESPIENWDSKAKIPWVILNRVDTSKVIDEL